MFYHHSGLNWRLDSSIFSKKCNILTISSPVYANGMDLVDYVVGCICSVRSSKGYSANGYDISSYKALVRSYIKATDIQIAVDKITLQVMPLFEMIENAKNYYSRGV